MKGTTDEKISQIRDSTGGFSWVLVRLKVPFHNWFYVSSAASGIIGIVTFDGAYKKFITDKTLTGTTGLKVANASLVSRRGFHCVARGRG